MARSREGDAFENWENPFPVVINQTIDLELQSTLLQTGKEKR